MWSVKDNQNRGLTIHELLGALKERFPQLTRSRLAKRVYELKCAELIFPSQGDDNAHLFSEHDVAVITQLLRLEEQGLSVSKAIAVLRSQSEPVEYACMSRAQLVAVLQKTMHELAQLSNAYKAIAEAWHCLNNAPLRKRILWALFRRSPCRLS